MARSDSVEVRAARLAALGDPIRLAIADELAVADRAPVELRRMLGVDSNLLAHHLDVLEGNGLITRHHSSGDGRRRYVHLQRARPRRSRDRADRIALGPAVFVCTHNSARSQLAAALWTQLTGHDAVSAGTDPADRVHPGAVASARRIGLDLSAARPRRLGDLGRCRPRRRPCATAPTKSSIPDLTWLHWSIPDPVPTGTRAAFDAARDELHARISDLAGQAA